MSLNCPSILVWTIMPVPPCTDWSLRDPRRLARIIAVNAWLMDREARVHRGKWGVKVIMFSSGVSLFVRILSSGLLQTSLSCFCGFPWGAGFSSSIHRADSWPLRLGNREAWWFTTRREIELEMTIDLWVFCLRTADFEILTILLTCLSSINKYVDWN